MSLTEDERQEVEHELRIMREAEASLLAVDVIGPDAGLRRAETLGRLRSEIVRVERLLSSDGAFR